MSNIKLERVPISEINIEKINLPRHDFKIVMFERKEPIMKIEEIRHRNAVIKKELEEIRKAIIKLR